MRASQLNSRVPSGRPSLLSKTFSIVYISALQCFEFLKTSLFRGKPSNTAVYTETSFYTRQPWHFVLPTNQQLKYPARDSNHRALFSKLASCSPSPNCGVTVADITAIGPEQESIALWRERCGIDKSKQIRLLKLSHMRYRHPDLAQRTRFLRGKIRGCSTQWRGGDVRGRLRTLYKELIISTRFRNASCEKDRR